VSIALTCEHCGSRHSVHPRMAGREIRCPSCDATITVPLRTARDEAASDPGDVEEPVTAPSGRWLNPDDEEETGRPFAATSSVAAPAMSVGGGGPATLDDDNDPAWGSAPEPTLANMPSLEDDVDEADLVDDLFRRKQREEEELDMTPMVDVTFLLLIFFMVTASFTLQKSIEMPRQTTDLPSTADEDIVDELDVVELEIDEFGSFLVLAPDWERETPGKQNLTNTLIEAVAGRRDGMKLNIKVHEMAKLQALVDGMDAGTIAGYTEIKVAQVDGFD